jgi:hypothetical protein
MCEKYQLTTQTIFTSTDPKIALIIVQLRANLSKVLKSIETEINYSGKIWDSITPVAVSLFNTN